LAATLAQNISKLTTYGFDLVVGIPRSGMLAASMISLYLNVNLCSFPELLRNSKIVKYGSRTIVNEVKFPQNAKQILIMEDSFGRGKRLQELLSEIPPSVRTRCVVGAVYYAGKEWDRTGQDRTGQE
jgi:hypoxanthine phosphoribosyltransferase